MRRTAAQSVLTVLLSGWVVMFTAGDPGVLYQFATQLAGVGLEQNTSVPDDDDETDACDVAVAAVTARRACRRTVQPDVPASRHPNCTQLAAPVPLPISSPYAPVPAFRLGAGAFQRC